VYEPSTGRLDSLVATAGAVTMARVKYTWDRGGREIRHTLALGSSGTLLTDTTGYDAAGHVTLRTTYGPGRAHTWYSFTGGYNLTDLLRSAQETRLAGAGTSYSTVQTTRAFTYDTLGGTGRLLSSSRQVDLTADGYSYGYDLFGNRTASAFTTNVSGATCQGTTRYVYGADNRLQADTLFPGVSCPEQTRVLTDQAGNRLGAVTNDGWAEPTIQLQKMTYTARNQLYFSLTATSVVGQYDANWHWYDGDGLRIMSQTYQASTWNQPFPVAAGYRGYYLYDGSDVALVVQRAVASGAFTVRARYVTGGLDAQWVARLLGPNGTGYVTLALVPDHQGSTVAAVQEGDSLATSVAYCARDAFGGMQPGECTSGAGATNTETGYTGASTPNNRGGFVYLRNRWYDPATGKFLTQDPIGLAGGVNLYAYAGNDPVTFSDPFGLRSCSIDHPEECKWFTVSAGSKAGFEVKLNMLPVHGHLGASIGVSHAVSFGGSGLTYDGATAGISAGAQAHLGPAHVGASGEATCTASPGAGASCQSSGVLSASKPTGSDGDVAASDKSSWDIGFEAAVGASEGLGASASVDVHVAQFATWLAGIVYKGVKILRELDSHPVNVGPTKNPRDDDPR
jgi:RHS repeat-associated protein